MTLGIFLIFYGLMATTYKYLFLKIFYVIVICLEFGALTASLMLCQLIFKMFARYFINLDTVLNIVQFEYVMIFVRIFGCVQEY